MRGVWKLVVAAATTAIIWAPVQARADGYVSPWVGTQFGSDIDHGRTAFGVTAGIGSGKGIVTALGQGFAVGVIYGIGMAVFGILGGVLGAFIRDLRLRKASNTEYNKSAHLR